MRRATFWAISFSYPWFLGWILPLGWVSGWVGGVGDLGLSHLVDLPLSSWGYGPAPFQLGMCTGRLLSPIVPSLPSLMRFSATRCIYMYFETGALGCAHDDTFSVSVVDHRFLPLRSSNLFCYLLWSRALGIGCSTQDVP